jgi:hypothetical protein
VFTLIVLPEGGTNNSPFFTLLARPDARTIVIASQGDAGLFVTSSNGNNGQGWEPLGLPDGSFVSDLEANSPDLWVAVGSNPDGDQNVWSSRDGGISWEG